MKDLNYKELIACASAFISFILPKIEIDEIILFGSVARMEATEESDIDIFFNTKKDEKRIKKIINLELEKFYKSDIYEKFKLKGIKNSINAETGYLENWKLKRSILSEGIILYGKYKALPEKTKSYIYFSIKPIKNITKRNRVIRHLFGRNEENYNVEGSLKKASGKKLSSLSFIIPAEKAQEALKYLHSEKIDFIFFEFWTDQIS